MQFLAGAHNISMTGAFKAQATGQKAGAAAFMFMLAAARLTNPPNMCLDQHTWEPGTRACKLADPLLVGTHAARPAEPPALQIGGCAQSKCIVLCIPLPVHLVVLAPAGRCASWSGSRTLDHYAQVHAVNLAGPDAALLEQHVDLHPCRLGQVHQLVCAI